MERFQTLRKVSLPVAGAAFVAALAVPSAPQGQVDPKLDAEFTKSVRPLVTKYCAPCHDGQGAAGGFDVAQINGLKWVDKSTDEADKLVQRLRGQIMPPPGSPSPTVAEREALVSWFQRAMATKCDLGDIGKVTIRRLNRSEYNNTVRDLVGVDLHPADAFPSDDVGYGFDTIGDVLSVSPLHFEMYMAAAEKLARAAVPVTGPSTQRLVFPADLKLQTARLTDESEVLFFSEGKLTLPFKVASAGDYRVRVAAYGMQGGPALPNLAVGVNGRLVQNIAVNTLRGQSKVVEIPVELPEGHNSVSVAFTNDYYDEKFPDPEKRDRNLVVQWVEVEGPLAGSAPRKPDPNAVVFTYPKRGDHVTAARTVLGRFASRAFRRPVSGPELDRIMAVYDSVRRGGDSYEKGIQVAVQAVLVSPNFLYRAETDDRPKDGKTNVPLDPYDYASRISYFLWSSMPDQQLTDAAAVGKIMDPRVVDAQVERMLADPKSKALSDDFVGQWLQLRKLATLTPDPTLFPMVDDKLKADMARETKYFFMDVLRNKRPVIDLVTATDTQMNERLADFYGVPGVKGEGFRRVDTKGLHRGGLLGMASFLTVTSNPNRTSPVKRGRYVLEEVLGTPPPPQPPNTPVLADDHKAATAKTIRERMAAHRADPACASCHVQMDAIGFALENFDPVGRWRTMDGPFKVDATGTLPGGQAIDGVDDLRKVLAGRRDEFLRAITEKLLVYGLGRGLRPADRCSVDEIVKQAKAGGSTLESIIKSIVKSDVFRKRAYTGEAR